jgi:membrane protease YdiL (CAAX protease family)
MIRGDSSKAFVFYAITLALAILVRLAVPILGEASLVVTMMTPAIGTVLMLAVIAAEGGFRKAIASLGLDSAGFRGWPLAIGGPVLIHAAGLLILAASGLTMLAIPEITGSDGFIILKITLGFGIATLFALGEEVGWRGYMLPRLKELGLVVAMLLVGLLQGLWHMPLLLTTDYYHSTGNPFIVVPLFLTTLTVAGVFFGFLRIWTGSVWPVAVAHAAANMAWELSAEVSQSKSELVLEYVGGESGVIMIGGLLIIDLFLVGQMRKGKKTLAL